MKLFKAEPMKESSHGVKPLKGLKDPTPPLLDFPAMMKFTGLLHHTLPP